MGLGSGILKVILVVVNVIFFLAGAAVMGVGIWLRVDPNIANYKGTGTGVEEFQAALYTGAYILIGFGAFTLLVSFCGCFGALKESKCLLGIYITLIACILAAELAGGIYVYVRRAPLIDELTKSAKKYLNEDYNKSDNTAAAKANREGIDFVMKYLECCGVDGPKDFKQYEEAGSTVYFPPACCKQTDKGAGKYEVANNQTCEQYRHDKNLDQNKNKFNSKGCKQALEDWFQSKAVIILGTAGGVAGFELIVLICAVILCCSIEKD